MSDKRQRNIVSLPTTALLAALVTLEAWFLAVYAFLGHKDPLQQGVCAALSIAASIFLATAGRKGLGGRWPAQPDESIGVTALQAG